MDRWCANLKLDALSELAVLAPAGSLAHELGIDVDLGHVVHNYRNLHTTFTPMSAVHLGRASALSKVVCMGRGTPSGRLCSAELHAEVWFFLPAQLVTLCCFGPSASSDAKGGKGSTFHTTTTSDAATPQARSDMGKQTCSEEAREERDRDLLLRWHGFISSAGSSHVVSACV
eukprot:2950477-Rhodomonas_salina.1